MDVLIVMTSHDRLGDTGYKTGLWLAQLTTPYYIFKDAGADITLASICGGAPPIDPRSDERPHAVESLQRFRRDTDARTALADTIELDRVDAADFDGVFYPGGYGCLWDLPNNEASQTLLRTCWVTSKPLALVCHAPAALRYAKDAAGRPLVYGHHLTGFSNAEETAAGFSTVVPFLLQDELLRLGARYSKSFDGDAYVVRDDFIVTGQNAASAAASAAALLDAINTARSSR